MRILIFFIIVISARLHGFTQNFNAIEYKNNANNAYEMAIRDSSFREAIKYLNGLKKKYGFLYGEEYALKSYCFKMLGKSKKSAKNVGFLWSNLVLDWNYLFEINEISPPNLIAGFSKNEMKIVNKSYDNFQTLPKHEKADSIWVEIEKLLDRDQEYRMKEPFEREKVRFADSMNYLEFKNIVLKYGYPGESFSYGGKCSRANVLIVHFADYPLFFNEFDPILINEVKAGRMPPSDYLRWLDRHVHREQNKSLYAFFYPPNTEKSSNEEIRLNRLKFGVVTSFPIPSKEWAK